MGISKLKKKSVSWTESNAVDRFFKDKNVKIINTNIFSQSAYIIKE
jgi:hypothetical protein